MWSNWRSYASANLFLTKKQRKELAKERRKGKVVRGTCSTRWEEETEVTVESNCAADLAGSFDIGRVSDPGTVRMQPMRVAQLHMRNVVDASNSSHPDGAVSHSSCSSSSTASESSSRTDSDASMSTATPTSSSSSSSKSPVPVEPRVKKFRRRGTPSNPTMKEECIDVDNASSSAPLATLLRESDHYPTDYINC